MQAAAEAGYRVIAIDAFADRQTRATAQQVFQVEAHADGFDAEALMGVVDALSGKDYCGAICDFICGFIYGSGFETQPQLLQAISQKIPLLGNLPATVAALKSQRFFTALSRLAIPHPQTDALFPGSQLTPRDDRKILRKKYGGCGGTHIRPAQSRSMPSPSPVEDLQASPAHYYQTYISGTPLSLLFIANKTKVEALGFNEQWTSLCAAMPFRYGGAVSHAQVSAGIKRQLIEAAEMLTLEFGLIGLNSLDAILHDGKAYILEVNPRLSATLDLYAEKAVILARHIEACRKQAVLAPFLYQAKTPGLSHAHAVVYAAEDLLIAHDFDWPEWATDIPVLTADGWVEVKSQMPVCTVFASCEDAQAAKQLAQSRVKILHESLVRQRQVCH